MAWRTSKALDQLRKQVNLVFPFRDKSSDGTIGDLSHKKTKSDHNPNSKGVVTAWDCTKLLSTTVTVQTLVDVLQKNKDPRLKYIIWNGRITKKGDITKWKPYSGKNKHTKHAHISFSLELYDDDKEWNLSGLTGSEIPNPVQVDIDDEVFHTVKSGDTISALSVKYGVKISVIKSFNELKNDTIKIGQRLRIQ